jgi:hypothetical protein
VKGNKKKKEEKLLASATAFLCKCYKKEEKCKK